MCCTYLVLPQTRQAGMLSTDLHHVIKKCKGRKSERREVYKQDLSVHLMYAYYACDGGGVLSSTVGISFRWWVSSVDILELKELRVQTDLVL